MPNGISERLRSVIRTIITAGAGILGGKVSVRRRLVVAFSIFVLLNILISISSICVINTMSDTLQTMSGTYLGQMDLAYNLDSTNKDMMANLQRFVNDPKTAYLENVYTDIARLKTLKDQAMQIDADSQGNEILYSVMDTYQELDGIVDVIVYDINSGKASVARRILNESSSSVFDKLSSALSSYVSFKKNTIADRVLSIKVTKNIAMVIVVISVFAGVILGLVLLFVLTDKIMKPIKMLAGKSKSVSGGDLTVSVEAVTGDEIEALAKSFSNMVAILRTILLELGKNAVMLLELSKNIQNNVRNSATTSEQISTAVQDTSRGAEKQVDVIIASQKLIEKASRDMQKISSSTSLAQNMSSQSGQLAILGVEKMSEVTRHMEGIDNIITESLEMARELEDKSANVTSITKIISEITAQTKLLSLNATIEAAKAGEMGKSFAVVAQEIRKLAQKSKEATADIDDIIKEIKGRINKTAYMANKSAMKTKKGMEVVKSANQAFDQIFDSSKEVMDKIDTVHGCVKDMEEDNQLISQSFVEITNVAKVSSKSMQQVAAAVQQQVRAMNEISLTTDGLTKLSNQLHEILAKFKTN